MGVLEFMVPMRSEKCEKKIRRSLAWLPGVDSIEVDRKLNKVTVTGLANPTKVLKRLRRTGKTVELWPEDQYDPTTFVYGDVETAPPVGYDHDYGYDQRYRVQAVHDDEVTNMFNDDNPKSCSVM